MNLDCESMYCRIRRLTAKDCEGLLFYEFPSRSKSPDRRQQWINAVKRHSKSGRPWAPGWQSSLCSRHFFSGAPSKDPTHPDYAPHLLLNEDDIDPDEEPSKAPQSCSVVKTSPSVESKAVESKTDCKAVESKTSEPEEIKVDCQTPDCFNSFEECDHPCCVPHSACYDDGLFDVEACQYCRTLIPNPSDITAITAFPKSQEFIYMKRRIRDAQKYTRLKGFSLGWKNIELAVRLGLPYGKDSLLKPPAKHQAAISGKVLTAYPARRANFVPRRHVFKEAKRDRARPKKSESIAVSRLPILLPQKHKVPQEHHSLQTTSQSYNSSTTIAQNQGIRGTSPGIIRQQDIRKINPAFSQHQDTRTTTTLSQHQDKRRINPAFSKQQDTRITPRFSQHQGKRTPSPPTTQHQDPRYSQSLCSHVAAEAIKEFEEAMETFMQPSTYRGSTSSPVQVMEPFPYPLEPMDAALDAVDTSDSDLVTLDVEDDQPRDVAPVLTESSSLRLADIFAKEKGKSRAARVTNTAKKDKSKNETLGKPEHKSTAAGTEEKKNTLFLELNGPHGRQLICWNSCKISLNREDYSLLRRLHKYMKRDRLLPKDWPSASTLAYVDKTDDDEECVEIEDFSDSDGGGDGGNNGPHREGDPQSLSQQKMSVDNKTLELNLYPSPSDDDRRNRCSSEEDWPSDEEETQPTPGPQGNPMTLDHPYSSSDPPYTFPFALKKRLDHQLRYMYPDIPWILMPWPAEQETFQSQFASTSEHLMDIVCNRSVQQ